MGWVSGRSQPIGPAGVACIAGSVRGRPIARQREGRRAISARLLQALVIASWLAQGSTALAAGLPQDCQLDSGETHTAARVLDGETLVIDEGREVRLAGILAPRAADIGAATWEVEMEAARTLGDLVAGLPVSLHFGGRRVDRYGRLLAQAVAIRSGEAVWVQGHIVSLGMARAAPLAGSETCLTDLLRLEETARKAGRGLWQAPAYRVRDAARPDDLVRLGPTFHILEGRIVSVGGSRSHVYLNFGKDRRQDISVSIARKDAKSLSVDGKSARRDLAGRFVRVRGWTAPGAAMTIEAVAAAQIELIDAPTITSRRRPWPRTGARRTPRR